MRFLPLKVTKAARKAGKVLAADEPLNGGVDEVVADQTRLLEESVVVFLDAIPASENHCKHEEAVAALLLLWDNEPRCKSIMEHEVFKADHAAMRRKAAPKRKSPGCSDGQAASVRDGATPTLVPRPTTDQAAGARPSTVLAARAAARAAAARVTSACAAEGVPSAGAPARTPAEEPSAASPPKRVRHDS